MRGLYPIVDAEQCARRGLDVVDVAKALLPSYPPLLQLRAKAMLPRDTLHMLDRLAAAMDGAATSLVVNDRPDLALMAGCGYVHVGQGDLPVHEVRRCYPRLAVGVSTHDSQQLSAALSAQPDYVAFGPVFSTRSKLDAEATVGLDGLAMAGAACRAAAVPLVAIGGIDETSVAVVARHADLVAVIGAVVADSCAGIERRAAALSRQIQTTPIRGD